MKKSMRFFIVPVLLLTLLCGTAAVQAKADWTVLFYLCGTDLESGSGMASYNLAEIAGTEPNPAVNFVIETGGTSHWDSQDMLGFEISNSKLQRYAYDEKGYTLLEELPSAPMSDPETLAEFIRWGAAGYPAEKYMLILWDHGGGTALLLDELYEDEMMASHELGQALKAGGVQFEVLLLDACLMSNLETASAVEPYVHYMIASEELVSGYGSAYQEWLQYLYNAPYADGARFGRYFCDLSQQKYTAMNLTSSGTTLTWAVTDLTKLDPVKAAFAEYIREMAALVSDVEKYSEFAYFTKDVEGYGFTDLKMFDLGDFASRSRNAGISGGTVSKLTDAIMDAVLYQVKGQGRSYAQGLSFFHDLDADAETLDAYAEDCPVPEYLAFLDAVNQDWTYTSGTVHYAEADPAQYTIDTEVSYPDDGAHIQLNVTSGKDAVSSVDYYLFKYFEEEDMFLSLGENFNVDGDFETGVFTDRWEGSWTGYNDLYFQMDIAEETETQTLYNVPVILFDSLEDYDPDAEIDYEDISYLRIGHVHDPEILAEYLEAEYNDGINGYYEVYGIWDGYDSTTGAPDRNVLPMRALQGKYMSIVWEVYDGDFDFAYYIQSDPFEITSDFDVKEYMLDECRYGYIFTVKDVFGRKTTATPAFAEYYDGNVIFYNMYKEN